MEDVWIARMASALRSPGTKTTDTSTNDAHDRATSEGGSLSVSGGASGAEVGGSGFR
jgi:hypothetical protein